MGVCIPSFSCNQGNHCLPMSASSPSPRCPKTTHGDGLSSSPQPRDCLFLGPFPAPRGASLWAADVSSWEESKCLQYEVQAWLVWILVISIFPKSFNMKNKQTPESIARSSQHKTKGHRTSPASHTGCCMAQDLCSGSGLAPAGLGRKASCEALPLCVPQFPHLHWALLRALKLATSENTE